MHSESARLYRLRNGVEIPWISYGTGVIWKYTRNKRLFLKVNIREVLSSITHRKLHSELSMNLRVKQVLRQAYHAGFRMFDSGRIYGYSEKCIGSTLSRLPGVFVSTKCSDMDIKRECSPDNVHGNLMDSLNSLKRNVADIYFLHWPEENWIDVYAQIINEYRIGNCRAFGACNLNTEHIKQIEEAGLEAPMVIQTEIHPWNSKKELREYCNKKGICLMAHTPTARCSPHLICNAKMEEIARKHKKSVAQIIIRWHYQNNIIPVVNTSNKQHMIEDLDIFDFELSKTDMESLESLDEGLVLLNSHGIDDPNYIYNQ